jgi:LemA protein
MLIVLGVVLIAGVVVMATYNGLVRSRNEVKNSWNQIDVQLKRRHDLIPNLVETAKGYVKHEREVLENVTRARNLAQGAQNRDQQIKAEGQLGQALASFFSISERYPELKANQTFLALHEELTSTENKIAFARQHYNDVVMEYGNRRQGFPGVLLAGFFGFAEEPYWKIDDAAERVAPKVSFAS